MSSGLRYMIPVIPEKEPFPGIAEVQQKDRMREVLGLVHKRVKQIPEVSSLQKNVFGSAQNYPSAPFKGSGEMMNAGVVSDKIEYPNAPIFPTENGLNSPLGDWNRQEGKQVAMNAELRLIPRLMNNRFVQHAPVGIF
jgi:hypothetical protein